MPHYWLMKAEPESRIEKGKDVKFSIDDLKTMGTSQWDGVRSHEAKKIMKEKMKLGDKVLFYHSNCKTPGVYGLAEISREGYPDWSAWDPAHPYYDPKTKQDEPTWFMVDVRYSSHLEHPPTLLLLKTLAAAPSLPEEAAYIGADGHKAIKNMALINRGRLSVQPVQETAYNAVLLLGERGGWDALVEKPHKSKGRTGKGNPEEGVVSKEDVKKETDEAKAARNSSKRKAKDSPPPSSKRTSTRPRRAPKKEELNGDAASDSSLSPAPLAPAPSADVGSARRRSSRRAA